MSTKDQETTEVDTADLYIADQLEEPSEKLPILGQLGILALILLLIFGTGYVPRVLKSLDGVRTNTANIPDVQVEKIEDAIDTAAFETISVHADAAYVLDVTTNTVLYEKNADTQLPLASITKLMTALVAYELLADNSEISVTTTALGQDGNSGLLDGETFTLSNILDLTLLSSSNDGAYAIAAAAGSQIIEDGDAGTFVEAMNIKADELGLTKTYFRNPTGLDISETEGGAYGSARDVAFLMKYILGSYPNIIEGTTHAAASIQNDYGTSHRVNNTNPTVANIEGLIGSKTGYTDLAGGNLTIAFNAALNRPVIVVVLGSTYNARFDDVLTLTDAARATVNN